MQAKCVLLLPARSRQFNEERKRMGSIERAREREKAGEKERKRSKLIIIILSTLSYRVQYLLYESKSGRFGIERETRIKKERVCERKRESVRIVGVA